MKAFPNGLEEYDKYNNPQQVNEGMDLRDYFAAKAMQGMLTLERFNAGVSDNELARFSYQMADAMMEARK